MDTKRTSPKVRHFEGLYGNLDHLVQPEYLFLEEIATRSAAFNWVIRPHFHSHLYQFFFVTKGQVTLTTDIEKVKVKSPCVLVFAPNVIHGLHYSPNVKGKILTVAESIVENIFKRPSILLTRFEENQYLLLTNNSVKQLLHILDELDAEIHSKKSDKSSMIAANLTRLFVSIHRIMPAIVEGKQPAFISTLYLRFLELVKGEKEFSTIQSFARELGVTDTHLNRVCKMMVGKTALMIVHEQKIKKAQSYLLHTSYSISEIAWLLKFKYANHFTRVFRSITGITPRQFRENNMD